MSRHWPYLLIFIQWVFFEATGYLFGPTGSIKQNKVPWVTLSETVWDDEAKFPSMTGLLFVAMMFLAAHFAHWTFKKVSDLFTA